MEFNFTVIGQKMFEPLLLTTQKIRERGHLIAGVSKGIFGLSYRAAEAAPWQGFDVDLARAVAVAVLGDAQAVQYVSIAPEQRCAAVASGLVDIGTFNASATLGRETTHDVFFPQAMLYDGEAMMVRAADMAGIAPEAGVRGLSKRIVAVQQGATTAVKLERFFGDCDIDYELRAFATPDEALAGYASGQCNIYALDLIPLSGERLRLADADEHVILDEHISKEAMGPVVSSRDTDWLRAVTWILRSLIEAEELGLNSSNCRHLPDTLAPHLHAFLHPSADKLARLGLQESFPFKILQQVGNYGEIFNNNLGCASPLNMPRHRNALSSHGGLMISPSFQ